jgi:tetratricopeptide (TPR) repeat protein
MTETLFERYKEALRAGHVAVMRGRLEEAAAAYREAIAITGDRAVPRTALGSAQLRLGDPAGALESFDGALALEPDDDAALAGRAQALVVLRRTGEAALAYDDLAGIRLAEARLPQAVEAARRALAIEPTDERRARHARLVEDLRAIGGAGETGEADRRDDAAGSAGDGPDGAGPDRPDDDAAGALPGPDAGAGEADVDGDAGATGQPEASPEPQPDPEALIAAFEEATARGDAEAAAAAALAAAQAHRGQGRVAAAFDACLQGIGTRPGDISLHLLLADLAVDRGWTAEAGESYRQLLRLAELDGDVAAAELVRRTAAERLPGDSRFAAG